MGSSMHDLSDDELHADVRWENMLDQLNACPYDYEGICGQTEKECPGKSNCEEWGLDRMERTYLRGN